VEDTSVAKAVVHGIIAGVPVPFPTSQPNACENSGLSCPLATGQNYTYSAVIPVSSSYPKVLFHLLPSSDYFWHYAPFRSD